MKVRYSKDFVKSMKQLNGKILKSAIKAVNEVIEATSIDEISDCKKIETFNNVYRIRIGDRRAFFVLHIEIDGDVVNFEYLVSRGEAYDKKNLEKLRNRDC